MLYRGNSRINYLIEIVLSYYGMYVFQVILFHILKYLTRNTMLTYL